MGWWVFRGVTAAGLAIWIWYSGGSIEFGGGDGCYTDPNPDVQAVYCE